MDTSYPIPGHEGFFVSATVNARGEHGDDIYAEVESWNVEDTQGKWVEEVDTEEKLIEKFGVSLEDVASWVQDTRAGELYEDWYMDQVCRAEYAYEGDR